jgi:MFS family permease
MAHGPDEFAVNRRRRLFGADDWAGVLAARDFRCFLAGYTASLLGTSMSKVAIAFAVLDGGGTATDLGLVFAAGVVPQVLSMLAGGVLADRLGRRPVMLNADALRCCAQAALAAAVFAGHPPVWVFALLAAMVGSGDALFTPALTGLTVEIAPPGELGNANALLGTARALATVAGPALAGILLAWTSPALVIAADAGTYAASLLALATLRPHPAAQAVLARGGDPPEPPDGQKAPVTPSPGPWPPAGAGPRRDLRDGWAEFRAHRWLVIITVQFTLFNLLVWGPFLLIGAVLAAGYLGGAGAWGAVLACYGAGSVLGGLLAVGRRPHRPLAAATVATFGYAVPGALLAAHAPVAVVGAGALVAGTGSALGGAFGTTVLQQRIAPAALARVTAFQTVIAFAFGPVAFAAAGPAAAVAGPRLVLAFGAVWSVLSSAVVLAMPAVRAVTWRSATDRPNHSTVKGANRCDGREMSLGCPAAERLPRGRMGERGG